MHGMKKLYNESFTNSVEKSLESLNKHWIKQVIPYIMLPAKAHSSFYIETLAVPYTVRYH